MSPPFRSLRSPFAPAAPTLVKKYANRRLYDTQRSKYVTLEELSELIQAGTDVRVQDAESGEDLTQATLTQILIEGRGAGRLLPVPLLHSLVRMGDDALADFLSGYLSVALESYQQLKRGAQSIAPYVPFANAPFDATTALARLLASGLGWGNQPPPAAPPVGPSPPPDEPSARDEVAEMRRELEELKRSLGGKRRTTRHPK